MSDIVEKLRALRRPAGWTGPRDGILDEAAAAIIRLRDNRKADAERVQRLNNRVAELEAREASLVEALESIEEIAGDTFTHIPELKDIEVVASAAIAKARGETE